MLSKIYVDWIAKILQMLNFKIYTSILNKLMIVFNKSNLRWHDIEKTMNKGRYNKYISFLKKIYIRAIKSKTQIWYIKK